MRPAPAASEPGAPGARRWTLAAAAERVLELASRDGLRSVVFAALGETVYRRLVVFERELGTDIGAAAEPAVGSESSWLGPDRLAEYEALRPGHSARAAARLARGERCFATWVDGELVAVRWIAAGAVHIGYLGRRLHLDEGVVFHYDSYTAPAHRRRGLSTASQERLALVLQAEGHSRIARAILPENRAGLRDAKRAGFRPRGRIGYVRLGPWRRELRSYRGRPRFLADARRAVSILRDEGPRSLWFKVLGETVYRRLRLGARPLDEPIRLLTCALPLEFSFLEPDELDAYAALRRDQDRAEAASRLRRGERCWVARLEGRIVNARWVTTGKARIGYLGATFPLAPGEAYVYDQYTSPARRGLGVSGVASMELAHVLAAEGYKSMLGAVLPENTLGVHMQETAGYRRIGAIRSIRLGPWRRIFVPRRR